MSEIKNLMQYIYEPICIQTFTLCNIKYVFISKCSIICIEPKSKCIWIYIDVYFVYWYPLEMLPYKLLNNSKIFLYLFTFRILVHMLDICF
jgi:hypothetical protein